MSATKLITKEELFAQFKSGLEICFKFSRGNSFEFNLTSINQVLYPIFSKYFESDDCSENYEHYIPLDTNKPYTKKIEYAQSILKTMHVNQFQSTAKHLQEMFNDFPAYKRFLYSFNIGNQRKIHIAEANQNNLKKCNNIVSGKEQTPGSITYLFPDQVTVPNFIPKIDQTLYRTHYDNLNNFSIEEFQVVKIEAYDDYSHGMIDEINNLLDHQIIYKPNYILNFLITLQSKIDKKTIAINSKDLTRFNGQSIELAYQRKLFVSRDDAVSYLKKTAQTAIDNIQNSLKLI